MTLFRYIIHTLTDFISMFILILFIIGTAFSTAVLVFDALSGAITLLTLGLKHLFGGG